MTDLKVIKNRRIFELVVGYSIIISLFFILPSFKAVWVIALFVYLIWLVRTTGPQNSDFKYISKFAAFGNKGMGTVTKYMGIVMSFLVFITAITSVLFALIASGMASIFLPNFGKELLFVDIALPAFLISSIPFYRFYDRYLGWGEKLNLFFTKRFLYKLWKFNVKEFTTTEKDFIKKYIRVNEPLAPNLWIIANPQPWKERIMIERIQDDSLSKMLLSKQIIQTIPPKEKIGDYYIMKWAEDYIKLNPEILN
jgi:hypothetical protein